MRFFLNLPDGRSFPLEKPVVSVGAEPACDVVLAGPGVKGSHALVFRDARGWTVSAASADCDVRVRGKRVELAPLEPGESFSVGRASLTLSASDAPVRVEAAPAPSRLLGVLTDFASRLLVQRPSAELLEAALRGIADVTCADVGFLVSVEGDRRQALAATGSVPDSAVVDSLVDQVVGSGAPVLVPDVAAEAALAGAPASRRCG
ncbi:FHA domain-containing protein [Corallococcus sp. AS-1-12]|uniref:FHA domain-containing protein n=1 Tax=Corallococcus sp. AS-1-12 TaxID=2874598 RepID=UPI002102664A|nr:FHA domain-containing protein [Corallococcus sp. AS-1-12]